MSYFDDASLVMIPSGYKTSKVYSVKPTSGDGDLTFTRSNDTATRVGPDGLIEKVRTNLLLQSNQFDTTWTLASVTLTANQPDKDGGTNAWRVQFTGGSNDSYLYQPVINQLNTGSIYVKGTAGETALIGVRTSVGGGSLVTFNGNWQRITDTNASNGYFVISDFGGATATDFLIMNAQVEAGDIATDYIATTSAAVSVGPVANVPRLDYLNSSCPRLNLEPQRTNLALFSESFDNAAWTKTAATITANAVTSPDGYTNADSFLPTATTSAHSVDPATLINLGGVVGTFSVFAKYNGYHLSLSIAGTSTNWTGCVFDLQNGIARTPQKSGSQVVCTSKIEDYGNGWYRCSISYTPYTSGTFYTYIGATSTNNATLGNLGLQSFAANGTSGVYLYGAQVETSASYATSYIPTLGAAVTRGADACSKTGISSLIGQTEGTVFVEFQKASGLDTDNILFSLSDGTSANLAYVSTQGIFEFITASVTQAVKVGISLVSGTNKIAIYYKANDFGVYLNGASIFTDTVGSVGAMSKFSLGCYFNNNFPVGTTINQALLFKTRLSNSDLAALTA